MQWSLGVLSYMIPESPVTAPCSAYSLSSTLVALVGGFNSSLHKVGIQTLLRSEKTTICF